MDPYVSFGRVCLFSCLLSANGVGQGTLTCLNLFTWDHPLSNLFTWERGRLVFDRKAFLVKIVKVSVSLHSVPSV